MQLRILHHINANLTICFFKRLFEYYLELNGHTIHKFDRYRSYWNPSVDETVMKDLFGLYKEQANNEKTKLFETVLIDETSVNLAKQKILSGRGTLTESIIVKKHSYRLLCQCGLTGKEYYAFDIHYCNIQNYLMETCSHVFIEYYKNVRSRTEYTTFDRLFYIQQLCFILEIKTSYEKFTFGSPSEFYAKYYKKVRPIFSELIILFNKNLKVPQTARAFVKFLDAIFYNWTRSHLKVLKYHKGEMNSTFVVTLYPNKKCWACFKKLDLDSYKCTFYMNNFLRELSLV